MAIYVKYDGVPGNTTAAGYEDHFTVSSVHMGVSRGISMETGTMANRESGNPSLSEITITKQADKSLPILFQQSVGGAKGGSAAKNVEIKFVQTGPDGLEEYSYIKLTNALISSYSIAGDGEGIPMETICFSYAQIDVKYTEYKDGNVSGSPVNSGYDLGTGMPR